MAGNSNLHDSAKNKQDEFYTQLSLIENELKHYKAFFAGKTILCNCDDPYESNVQPWGVSKMVHKSAFGLMRPH